jgi:ribosomal protein S14
MNQHVWQLLIPMSISRLMRQDAVRRYNAFNKEEYSWFLHSVYNESRLYDNNVLNDLHSFSFKYTFFLSFKREKHSMRSTQMRIRCQYYGRARAVFSKYGMSRFAFKKFACNGDINGITKSSW